MTISMRGLTMVRRDGTTQTFRLNEAYFLMKYVNLATGKVEWLWNSRDGVTPFGVEDAWPDSLAVMQYEAKRSAVGDDPRARVAFAGTHHDPRMMNHADWHEDVFVPNFVPPIGMRVFVSWADAPQDAKSATEAKWRERIKDAPNQDELLKASPFGYVPEGPMVLAVDHELQERFLAAARDNPFIQTI